MNQRLHSFLVIFALQFGLFNNSFGQITITLQPNSTEVKDAFIRDLAPNANFGSNPELPILSWTYNGSPMIVRGLIDFDFSSIPSGATITSANLLLFNNPTAQSTNGEHSQLGGSNEMIIQRIVSTWDELTVTWNNQPNITNQNQVSIPASSSKHQDYTINVTELVQDIIDNPANSFGFMLKLQTEQIYRSVVFASREVSDSTLYPKIEISYIEPQVRCIALQPNAEEGKDAFIRDLMPDNNYSMNQEIPVCAWTYNGSPMVVRSILDFDFSKIPVGSTINSANLTLYNDPNAQTTNGEHKQLSGTNEMTVQRVISEWEEHTVTWNDQPDITTLNQVLVPASSSIHQDYVINVTSLVQDMVDNPTNSFGFMLKLQTEELYRSVVFASSDINDSTLRPKIEICFIDPPNQDDDTTNHILSLSEQSVKVGRMVEISVNTSELTEADSIIAYQFDFNFDASKLEYHGYNLEGTLSEEGMLQINILEGKLSVAWAGEVSINGVGKLVNFQFKSIDSGEIFPEIANAFYNTSMVNSKTGKVTATYKYGDIDTNNSVQAYDAALALRHSVGLDPIPGIDPIPWENWRIKVANVDGVGGITANDAAEILKYTVNLISNFTVENEKKSHLQHNADVDIVFENNELLFRSSGELFGLNIYVNENFDILGQPQVLNNNMLSAINITETHYAIGLASIISPEEGVVFLKIPVSTTQTTDLTLDMIINDRVKSITIASPTGIVTENEATAVLYPNPTSNILYLSGVQNSKITIFNTNGVVVMKQQNVQNHIDVKYLPRGVYTINIVCDEKVIIRKFVKN